MGKNATFIIVGAKKNIQQKCNIQQNNYTLPIQRIILN